MRKKEFGSASECNAESAEAVARSPKATAEMLGRLAYDEREIVRQEVARNPNTSRAHLMKLVSDRDFVVVVGLIDNPNTPLDALIEIARHPLISNRDLDRIASAIRERDPSRLDDLVDVVDEKSDAAH